QRAALQIRLEAFGRLQQLAQEQRNGKEPRRQRAQVFRRGRQREGKEAEHQQDEEKRRRAFAALSELQRKFAFQKGEKRAHAPTAPFSRTPDAWSTSSP